MALTAGGLGGRAAVSEGPPGCADLAVVLAVGRRLGPASEVDRASGQDGLIRRCPGPGPGRGTDG